MRAVKVFSMLMALAALASVEAQADQAAAEKVVRAMPTSYAEAWNKGDAKAVSEFYAEDGELVTPTGEVWKGRAAIAAGEGAALAGPYKGAKSVNTATTVTFSGPDAATAEGTWEITGITGADGKQTSAKGVWTASVVQKDGKWWIKKLQVTAAAPAPGTTTQPSGGTPR